MSAKRSFLGELKRRNVLRAGVLYIGVMWALSQGAAQLLPVFDVPNWIIRAFVVAGVIGFPFWLAFAWFYELTPQGLKRESELAADASIARHSGRRMDLAIIVVLTLAVVLLLADRFIKHAPDPAAKPGSVEALISSYGDRSIAVLPFASLSTDPEQEYFAEGIAEDVLNQLTKIGQLRVIARGSSFSFKKQTIDVAEIAKRLSVANILQGSVRKVGNRIRVSAQLIRASDSGQMWSENYDREVTDLFAVQDEISAAVAGQLKLRLLASAQDPSKHAVDSRAYPLYLQGRELGRLGTKEGLDRAEQVMRDAVGIDPNYAAAWDQLAYIYQARADYDILPYKEGLAKARELTMRALAADPLYAPAVARLGDIAGLEGDDKTNAEQVQRALKIDPSNRIVLAMAADLLQDLGHLPQALAINEYLMADDPMNPTALSATAGSYVHAGRYDDAIAVARMALTLTPGRQSALSLLADAYVLKGNGAEAMAAALQLSNAHWREMSTIRADQLLHHDDAVESALRRFADQYAKAKSENKAEDAGGAAWNAACVHAFRGERERAFEWIGKIDAAVLAGWSFGNEMLMVSLHDDPRWLALLEKSRKRPSQLAQIKLDVTLPSGHTTPDPAPPSP